MIDARHDDQRKPELVEARTEVVHRPRFVAQVELFGDLLAQARQVAENVERCIASLPGEKPRRPEQQRQVGRDDLLHPGPQDLDRDLVAALQSRTMHHRERRRRYR